jgi:group II intron reverse transcriptase/maturase
MYQRARDRRPIATDAHEGSRRDFYARHKAGAEKAATAPGDAREQFLAKLWDRITDSRTLLLAAEDVRRGGPAPGVDGISPRDLDWTETIGLVRVLREALRCGKYRPAPARRKKIPKRPGGTRTLSIPTVADRIVQRAVLLTLQPFLDPQFRHTTLGGRPGRSTADALTTAERLARQHGNWVWATADIKTAFDCVPHAPLLTALRTRLGDSPVLGLMETIITTGREVGIPQGGPLSPLLLNVFLAEMLDHPWVETYPDRPLIRWADDVLILTHSQKEAEDTLTRLTDTLGEAKLEVKQSSLSIACLEAAETIDWLGFRLTKKGETLSPDIKLEKWDELKDDLLRTHVEDRPILNAREIIRGWIEANGPVKPTKEIIARLKEVLNTAEVSDAATEHEIETWWHRAHRRFRPLEEETTERNHPGQDTGLRAGPTAPPVDVIASFVPDAATDTALPCTSDSLGDSVCEGHGRTVRVEVRLVLRSYSAPVVTLRSQSPTHRPGTPLEYVRESCRGPPADSGD